MKKNVVSIDKIIRVLIAVVIAVLYWQGMISGGTVAIVLLVLAAVFLLTSLLNFCPLYTILGINTCKRK